MMDHSTAVLMLRWGAGLLIVTLLGGVAMAVWRARANCPPSWLSMLHGFLAAAGLTLILFVGFTTTLAPMMWIGMGILLLAGAVGTYLNLRYHAHQRALPVPIIALHGIVAVVGLFIIVLGTLGQPAVEAPIGAPPIAAQPS